MRQLQDVCNPDLLERYLCGSVSNSEERSVELHLEDCTSCQSVIEDQAAEDGVWREASDLLGDERWRGLHDRPNSDAEMHEHESGVSACQEIASRQIRTVIESLGPTDDPVMLGRLGGYEISGVIGCGGMGAVLKGVDRSLNRVVAIKVMAPHLASSGAARQRFSREAQAAAAITHDNVIDIYGVSEADGLPYLVMPCATGPSLQKRIDERGALPLIEVLRIGCQVAAGLAAAHEQGLVHRDIKPANILLSDGSERLLITDFGLARAVDDATITRSGVIAGTPQYMSPEQARGEVVDHRSDLFSLGSVLYTACTGRPAFRGGSAYGILRKIIDDRPRGIRELNADVPEWLCRVVERLHSKSADARYQSAGEVAELLQQCVASVQTPGHPLPIELQSESQRFDRRIWLSAVVVTVGILAWSAVPSTENAQESAVEVSAANDDSELQPPSVTDVRNASGSVGSPQESDSLSPATAWNDDSVPSSGEIYARAKRLNDETRSFFPRQATPPAHDREFR